MKSTHKRLIYAVAVVATGFFWAGSSFFSYLEVLKVHFDDEVVYALTLGLAYGAQMLGILFYVLIAARNNRLVENKLVISLFFALSAIGISSSFITSNQAVIIISGVLTNFFGTSGVLLGSQFRCITSMLPQKYYGRAFGFAYAAGSLGTTLLALTFGGSSPVGYAAILIYVPIVLLNIALTLFKDKLPKETTQSSPPEHADRFTPAVETPVGKNLIPMSVGIFFVIGFLSAISGLMQHTYMHIGNQIGTEYVRVFYAVGLIPAGFLMDYSRRMGAISAVAANGLSFLLVLLFMTPGRSFEAVALSYFLSGFLNVFQVAISMDIAKKVQGLFYFSVFGFLFNRLGEVLGSLPYNYIEFDLLRETVLVSVFFVILLLMFFPFLKKLYEPVSHAHEALLPWQTLDELISDFGITEREAEALRLLLMNKNTSEIAEAMYITEGTVYKYISSMITKTNSKTRIDMIAKFSRHKS